MFFIALLFGAGQVILTKKFIDAFSGREGIKILLFFSAKFILYALGIGIVVLKYIWHIGMASSGFAVGAPIMAIGWFVYSVIRKSDIDLRNLYDKLLKNIQCIIKRIIKRK